MFVVSLTQTKLFYNESFLQSLKNVPGMLWTPAVPQQFKTRTSTQMKSMLINIEKQFIGQEIVANGDYPETKNWQNDAPECLEVRDQAGCGSCWAFAQVGAFSDTYCIQKKIDHVTFSEQFSVSCDTKSYGCDGGYISHAAEFAVDTGFPSDSCVPYTSGASGDSGKCPTKCVDDSEIILQKAAKQTGCGSCTEAQIMDGLTRGTMSTTMTVYDDFFYYSSGIYQHVSGAKAGGHAVIFVGWGVENGTKFWIIRNSWGAGWGESGYFRIVRGTGECGIESLSYILDF